MRFPSDLSYIYSSTSVVKAIAVVLNFVQACFNKLQCVSSTTNIDLSQFDDKRQRPAEVCQMFCGSSGS